MDDFGLIPCFSLVCVSSSCRFCCAIIYLPVVSPTTVAAAFFRSGLARDHPIHPAAHRFGGGNGPGAGYVRQEFGGGYRHVARKADVRRLEIVEHEDRFRMSQASSTCWAVG